MKTTSAPGNKARNNSYSGPWSKGAAIKAADATKRREPRGSFPRNPSSMQPLRGAKIYKAFDAQGVPSIPKSRIQKAA